MARVKDRKWMVTVSSSIFNSGVNEAFEWLVENFSSN